MYVLGGDGLVRLSEASYVNENELQELVARYPQLLNGDGGPAGRRYVLVQREHGIADAVDAADRWSVDHVFVDQDAVPVLVEVKRASDTRIRREVVGQMLDYAANATEYLPEGRLRASFEACCQAESVEPAEAIVSLVGADDVDVEAFWSEVDRNLRRGRVRLVFCSDRMPKELRRIAEFLNAQTRETEVVALEIAQHRTSDGFRVVAPRLFGETLQTPQRASPSARSRSWTMPDYLGFLRDQGPPGYDRVVADLVDGWQRDGLRPVFGTGVVETALFPTLDHGQLRYWMVAFYAKSVEIAFAALKTRPPFHRLDMRRELLRRLNAIEGVRLDESRIGKRPSFPSEVLLDEARRVEFERVFDWFVATVRAVPATTAAQLVAAEEEG